MRHAPGMSCQQMPRPKAGDQLFGFGHPLRQLHFLPHPAAGGAVKRASANGA
jgi:hypothetical protein